MKIPYTLERHLLEYGEQEEKYKVLYENFVYNKRLICDIIDETGRYFTFYSRHDSTHSAAIVSSIELLLGEERIRFLSPTDTFLLLLVAYLHDYGMSLTYEEIKKKLLDNSFNEFVEKMSHIDTFKKYTYWYKNDDFKIQAFDEHLWPLDTMQCVNVLISEFYRSKHGDRSEEAILKDFRGQGININPHKHMPERLEKLLGRLCSLHTKDFDEVMKLDHEANGAFNDRIHPRLLAVLIRIGDLLDLDNNRFDETKLRTVCEEIPQSSKVHYDKHKSVKSFLITPHKIHIVAESNDNNVLHAMREWVSWLEDELRHLHENWNSIVPEGFLGTVPKLVSDIKKGNSEILFCNKDLKLNLPEKKAFQLIQGSNIYKHNLIFIREYIQNALDALKVQFWNDELDQLNNFDQFDQEEILDTFEQKKNYIIKKYDEGKLEDDIKKYGINVRLFDGRIEEEKVLFKAYYNSDDYSEDDYKNKIMVVVEDNGTGISLGNFENRILNVGGKDKKDDYEIMKQEMPVFIKPTGEFGIGLQSGFLVADRLVIHTRTMFDEHQGREIIIESGQNTGFVQCNRWEEGASGKNRSRKRGTQVIVAIDPKRISIDHQFTTRSDQCEFPFREGKRDYLLDYLVNIASQYINEPFFNIRFLDAHTNLIKMIERENFTNRCDKEEVGQTVITTAEKNYKVQLLRDKDSNRWMHLYVYEQETGNRLELILKDSFEKERRVNTYYKGIKLEATQLEKDLEKYLLRGSNANINYSFNETREYITINRNDVTLKGKVLGEKVFKSLMEIGMRGIRSILLDLYEKDPLITDYIECRRKLAPIVNDIMVVFNDYTEKETYEYPLKPFNVDVMTEKQKKSIEELIKSYNAQIIVEVLIKLVASWTWGNTDGFGIRVYEKEVENTRDQLYQYLANVLNEAGMKMVGDAELNLKYMNSMARNLLADIGGWAKEPLGKYWRDEFHYTFGNEKIINRHFRKKIPALEIYLYHEKYAQKELLTTRYLEILEVLSDRYIHDDCFGGYMHDWDNEFNDIFLFTYENKEMKPVYFGSNAIRDREVLYVDGKRFFNQMTGDIEAIYPIEEMNVTIYKNKKTYFKLTFTKNEGQHVYIVNELQEIRDYLFQEIIHVGFVDVEEKGYIYFNDNKIACLPAIKNYEQIAVDQLPFEFQKVYNDSCFKEIQQESYIMIPITKDVMEEFGLILLGIKIEKVKIVANICKERFRTHDIIDDFDKIKEIQDIENAELYCYILDIIQKITSQKAFSILCEYTYHHRLNLENNIDEIRVKEEIKKGYIYLIRDLLEYVMDFMGLIE